MGAWSRHGEIVMKLSAALILFLPALCAPALAQTTHPKATAEDLRPNSPKVPDAYAISGHFSRIVVMRMKYRTDLLRGMEKLVTQQKIRNGVILSGIGSLRGYRVHSVSSRDLPPSDSYVAAPNAPANLNGMNGYIVDGDIHAHVTLAVNQGRDTVSGHLEQGCEVLTYAIVTVGVLDTPLGRVQEQNYR
jgi:predicted DNA-binding protein with PD1-like motif